MMDRPKVQHLRDGQLRAWFLTVTIVRMRLPSAIVLKIKGILEVSVRTELRLNEHFPTNISFCVNVRLRWFAMPIDRYLRPSERNILISTLRICEPGAYMFLLCMIPSSVTGDIIFVV